MFRVQSIWYSILEHPLVQYIPLNKDPLASSSESSPALGTKLNIRVFNRPEDLRPTLNKFGLNPEILRLINWDRELPILATNMVIKELLYRTNKVVGIAEERKNYLELFTVNRRYFYRESVFFIVYDERGRRLPTPTNVFTIEGFKKPNR